MPKSFVDTNIWIYAFLDSPENQLRQKSLDFLEKIIQEEKTNISIQVLNEFHWALSRKYKISEDRIEAKVNSILEISNILPLTLSVYSKSKSVRDKYQVSFWDSLLISSALEKEIEIFYSEDLHDGLLIDNKLKISNPFK